METERLIDELTRAIDGDPWHGDPVVTILAGITATHAARRPGGHVHTIWEIVRHMTAWTAEVSRRLAGHPAGVPREGDWPQPSGDDEAAWQRDIALFLDTHRQLLARLASFTDAQLYAPTTDPRDRPSGSGVSGYVLVHGLSQHHAYHAGQIAVLKKL